MSVSQDRATRLVAAYDHSLEQQILERGSNRTCRDEELWLQVEEMLRDQDARETHCLGLDPLRVMEESLAVEAAPAAGAGRVKPRGGLLGLAKAFEVLEQAALNLYLGPWRKEYKVVKMYSGMFTHYIKPVMSVAQIEKMFGLLGYQFSSTRQEQLQLQVLRAGPAFLEELLRLSCAFFLARCECRLLLTALGKRSSDAQWALSVVRERQRGHNLRVAVDNTERTLGGKQPTMETFDGESDVDLYTDDQIPEGQREVVVHGDDASHSLGWDPVKTQSNGATSSPSPLTNVKADTFESSAANRKCPGEDPPCGSLQGAARGGRRSEAEAPDLCSCVQSHRYTHSALLEECCLGGHKVLPADEAKDSPVAPPQSLRVGVLHESPSSSSSAALSSLSLCDKPKSMSRTSHPISFHDCCSLTHPDPRVVCLSCGVFHSGSCRGMEECEARHQVKELGLCSCGRTCSRKPLVLCRYCGNEYCNNCWYRNPVSCVCGQTFDQSSPV